MCLLCVDSRFLQIRSHMVAAYGASEILQDMVGGWVVVGCTCNGHELLIECMLISLVLDGGRTEVTSCVCTANWCNTFKYK